MDHPHHHSLSCGVTAFAQQKNPRLGKAEVETRTLDSMATMPAWRDHPEVLERRRRRSG